MPFEIVRNDITKIKANAIVTPLTASCSRVAVSAVLFLQLPEQRNFRMNVADPALPRGFFSYQRRILVKCEANHPRGWAGLARW